MGPVSVGYKHLMFGSLAEAVRDDIAESVQETQE